MTKKRGSRSPLYVVLTAVYVTALLTSNILAVKQFNFFSVATLPAAVLVFPITYILSDVFSECYGYKASRNTRYLGFACNLAMCLLFAAGIALPSAESFTSQAAMTAILGSTPRMLAGSFAGFLLGDFANDIIFARMKKRHADSLQGFRLRAIVSSLVGEACDSLLFFPIAFGGVLPASLLLSMGIAQVLTKVAYESIICPLTGVIAQKIARYEQS